LSDEDEDYDADSDMDSESTAAPLENQFTDIAQATSSVESAIDMAEFMNLGCLWWVGKDGDYTKGSMIDKASSMPVSHERILIFIVGFIR
jgi:hypothetical protein